MKIEKIRNQGSMIGILQRVNFRVKVYQGSRKGFPTKDPLVLKRSKKVGCLTLSHNDISGGSYVDSPNCVKSMVVRT